MALSPADGEFITNLESVPQVLNDGLDLAPLEVAVGRITFTAAGQGTAGLVKLPAGRIRVFTALSRIVCPQGAATADLHVGHGAYTDLDGALQSADDNEWADNLDVGGGAIAEAFSLPASTTPYSDYESQNGIEVQIMIDTADSPAAGTAYVIVVFCRDAR